MARSVLDYSSGGKARPVFPTWSRRKRFFWVCVTLAGGALLLSLPFVLSTVAWQHAGTSTDTLTQGEIERIGQFRLPSSARNVRSHYDSWMDFNLLVRFEMSPSDIDAFIRSTFVERPLWTTEVPSEIQSAHGRLSWWNPGTPQPFEAGGTDWRPISATTLPTQPSDWRTPTPTTTPGTHPPVEQVFLIDETDSSRYVVWMSVTNAQGH